MIEIEKPAALYAALLSVALIWGASFAAAKIGISELAPLNLVVLRFIVAAAIFAAILAARRAQAAIDRRDVPRLAVLGFLMITSYFYIQYTALLYTTTINAALIVATSPVWAATLAAALGWERVTAAGAAGVLLAFAGVALVIGGGREADLLSSATLAGDLLILVNAVTWAGMTLYGKTILQKYPPFTAMAWVHIFGTIMLLPFAVIATPLAPLPLIHELAGVTWRTAASVGYLAVLSSVYAYYVWYLGVEKLGAVRTAAFSYFNPLFAAIVGVLFMGETLSGYVLVGGLVVIAGVWLINRAGRAPRSEP